MTHSKDTAQERPSSMTGWCASGQHRQCPREVWLSQQQQMKSCGCPHHDGVPGPGGSRAEVTR